MAIPRSYHLLSHLLTTPNLNSLLPSLTTRRRMPISCTLSKPNSIGSEVCFSVGTHLIPHPNKVERGGEDAFFVSAYSGGVIAVADGVSGWAERNVDPALFSRELMSNALSFVEEVDHDPRFLLRRAHAATFSIGSATAIIAMLERNGVLKIANVGDCGLRIIRKGQILFSTFPQEHYFDCPYQLSSEEVGQTYQDAMVCSVELEEGDTIIMGSDGLFDNVFDHEIVSTIANNTDVVTAAKALADLARNHSVDTRFDSPYSIEARARVYIKTNLASVVYKITKHYQHTHNCFLYLNEQGFDLPSWKKALGVKLTGITWRTYILVIFLLFNYANKSTTINGDFCFVGGKLDDITVIVAQVRRSDAKVVSS